MMTRKEKINEKILKIAYRSENPLKVAKTRHIEKKILFSIICINQLYFQKFMGRYGKDQTPSVVKSRSKMPDSE